MNETRHTPVLLNEIIAYLQPTEGKRFIDATLGGAGHTRVLLENGSTVLGIDQDKDALSHVQSTVSDSKLVTAEANFMTIKTQADKYGFKDNNGILFDLGVSSFQFDRPERGFSFNHVAPLDMRMNQGATNTAADLVNNSSEDELFEILINNAQEPKAREIARQIIAHRPLKTTKDLGDLVMAVYRGRRGHIHPATLTFQALRIAVNQELKVLKPALKDAFSLLAQKGLLCVISFHEGEDRIVKRTFLELAETGRGRIVNKNPVTPTAEEIIINPRSRSAKLRVIERIS
jgi:16S rRNA (cytosine1402-N4)-methyltransferase